jgi:hypothetical protein
MAVSVVVVSAAWSSSGYYELVLSTAVPRSWADPLD